MLICTTNPHKIAEFAGLLAPLDIRLTPASLEVPETGHTFEANAREKALGYARQHAGHWILVDDSGLVVPALDGLPAAYSARFADLDVETRRVRESRRAREVIDPLNNQRVLDLMQDVPPEHRGAHFVASDLRIGRDDHRDDERGRLASGAAASASQGASRRSSWRRAPSE